MLAFFGSVWDQLVLFLHSINIFTTVIDVLLVAFVVYNLIKLVRDSRAEQLIKGIIILAVAYLIATLLDLKTMHYLLKLIFDNGLLVLVVIFQPEIRRALEQAGHSRFGGNFRFGSALTEEQRQKNWSYCITAVCRACETLQRQKMGALIVFERNTKLAEIVRTGTVVEADATAELIGNIFFNKAPLHDGAMIIREGRVFAAGCILPLSELSISRELGTRHRAALGMSENSDAIVAVVSEETGTLSLAQGGELKRGYSIDELRTALENALIWDRGRQEEKNEKKQRRYKQKNKKGHTGDGGEDT